MAHAFGLLAQHAPKLLLEEEGGFLYDSDAYNDDLPHTLVTGERRHIVLPYAFDTNDMQFFHTNRFSGAADFAAYVIDAFDWLHREGAHAPKMMSIGLHLRIIGRPGRIGALERILAAMRARSTACGSRAATTSRGIGLRWARRRGDAGAECEPGR